MYNNDICSFDACLLLKNREKKCCKRYIHEQASIQWVDENYLNSRPRILPKKSEPPCDPMTMVDITILSRIYGAAKDDANIDLSLNVTDNHWLLTGTPNNQKFLPDGPVHPIVMGPRNGFLMIGINGVANNGDWGSYYYSQSFDLTEILDEENINAVTIDSIVMEMDFLAYRGGTVYFNGVQIARGLVGATKGVRATITSTTHPNIFRPGLNTISVTVNKLSTTGWNSHMFGLHIKTTGTLITPHC